MSMDENALQRAGTYLSGLHEDLVHERYQIAQSSDEITFASICTDAGEFFRTKRCLVFVT